MLGRLATDLIGASAIIIAHLIRSYALLITHVIRACAHLIAHIMRPSTIAHIKSSSLLIAHVLGLMSSLLTLLGHLTIYTAHCLLTPIYNDDVTIG